MQMQSSEHGLKRLYLLQFFTIKHIFVLLMFCNVISFSQNVTVQNLPNFQQVISINDNDLIAGVVNSRTAIAKQDSLPKIVDGALGNGSFPRYININGQVAGEYNVPGTGGRQEFLYDPIHGTIDLAVANSTVWTSINNDLGQVFWVSYNSSSRVITLNVRDENGTTKSTVIPNTYGGCYPFDANSLGQALLATGSSATFIASYRNAVLNYITLENYNKLYDINNRGQAVGAVITTQNRAIIWDEQQGIRNLLQPGVADSFTTIASSINDSGLITMTLTSKSNSSYSEFAFYSPTKGLIRLPQPQIPIPPACKPGSFKISTCSGGGISPARDATINDHGQAIVRVQIRCQVGRDYPTITIPAVATIDKGIQILPLPRGLKIEDLFQPVKSQFGDTVIGDTVNIYSNISFNNFALNNNGKMVCNFITQTYDFGVSTWTSHIYDLNNNVLPSSPILISPLNNLSGQSSNLTFKWHSVGNASSYNFQLSPDHNFNTDVSEFNNITDTQQIVNGLARNETYYWRVIANAGSQHSVWSETWGFSTRPLPPVPIMTSPFNFSDEEKLIPNFCWFSSLFAKEYVVQIDDNENFSHPVTSPRIEDNGIASQCQSVLNSPLLENVWYYWRIKAIDDENVSSPWSAPWKFKKKTVLPPELQYPTPHRDCVEADPIIRWSAVADANSYEIQCSEVFNFESGQFSTGNTTYQVALNPHTKYYWGIRAICNDYGNSNWAIDSFTTAEAAPPKPNGSFEVSPEVSEQFGNWKFTWKPYNTSYGSEIQIAADPNFMVFYPIAKYMDAANASIESGQRCFARIRYTTHECQVPGEWSDVQTIDIPAELVPPVTVSPVGGTSISLCSVNLSWETCPGATDYTIELSENSDFSSPSSFSSATTPFVPSNLKNGQKYYWHIKANYANGVSSDWSSAVSFTASAALKIGTPEITVERNSSQVKRSIALLNADECSYNVAIASNTNDDNLSVIADGASFTTTPGASIEIPLTVSVGNIETGSYFIPLVVTNSLNGFKIISTTLKINVVEEGAGNLPDLAINSNDINQANNENGETYEFTIHNLGNSAANSFLVRIFNFGQLIHEEPVSFLDAGSSYTIRLVMPSPSGDRMFSVVVDPVNEVRELNESNNECNRFIHPNNSGSGNYSGLIRFTVNVPSFVYAGRRFDISGNAFYDFTINGVHYTDYVVKGAAVAIVFSGSPSNNLHTTSSGDFDCTLWAPTVPGNYKATITISDQTFSGTQEFIITVKEAPQGGPSSGPAPDGTPFSSGPYHDGHWEPQDGGYTWVSSDFGYIEMQNLYIYSENILFSPAKVSAGENMTIGAVINYSSTDTRISAKNVKVNLYATQVGGGRELIQHFDISSIAPFNPQMVFANWKIIQNGIYIIEAVIESNADDDNTADNAATRALIVGDVQQTGQGVLSGQVHGPSGSIGNVVIELRNSDGALAASTLSDNNGFYLFQNVNPDEYFVWCIAPSGYAPASSSKSIAVAEQSSVVIDFWLDFLSNQLSQISDLTARVRNNEVQLTWTHNGSDVYQIYRSERSVSDGFTLISTTNNTYSTFLDTNLSIGKKYWYFVAGAYSTKSNIVDVIPVGRTTRR